MTYGPEEYITVGEDMTILAWRGWQDSWEAEFEAGIIDIISPSAMMMYLGEADWGPIPVQMSES